MHPKKSGIRGTLASDSPPTLMPWCIHTKSAGSACSRLFNVPSGFEITGSMPIRYADAGVNIAVADEAKRRIRTAAGRTFTRGVLSQIGGFGALYQLDRKKWRNPILVSS